MSVRESEVHSAVWGTLQDGRPVRHFVLNSAAGVRVELTEYGARLVRVQTLDASGQPGDVTLGHDALPPYLRQELAPYFGATIGRYANRIAHGRFSLGAESYQLALNNAPNHLHGGMVGYDAVPWTGTPFEDAGGRGVEFQRVSPDGEEGYPGRLDLTVRYTLSDDGTLSFEARATTDRLTIINLTNHAYWNLANGGAGTGLTQTLTLAAAQYLPVDETAIPLGPAAPVDGTPFDFREARPVGERIDLPDEQLGHAGGYDHHFLLPDVGGALQWAATLRDPASGRQLEVWTTEPGLQVYSGNFLDGSIVGRDGARYARRSAVCLETQHAPDSPNRPAYPSVRLAPGETFRTRTEWRFSATRPD